MQARPSTSPLPRQPVVRPTEPDDWEPYKTAIAELYDKVKLRDVMKHMETAYRFKATEKQYKTQIKKWNLDTKYTRRSEYLAMIRIRRQRERENPGKKTRFVLHGKVIDRKDIVRFEKRAVKKGLVSNEGALSDYDAPGGPVDDLTYETPSPSPSDSLEMPGLDYASHGVVS